MAPGVRRITYFPSRRPSGAGLVEVGADTVLPMSDDLQESGARREPSAGASRRLTDPGWLVNADPAQVWAGLDCAAGAEEVLVAAVYRASMRVHKYAAPGVRRQLLALDAARYGAPELAAELAAAEAGDEPDAEWRVEWASGSLLGSAHTNASTLSADKRATWATSSLFRPEDLSVLGGYYPDEVAVVATAAVGGRTLALVTLTGSNSLRGKLVQVWDVATGRPVGEPLTGHTDTVRAVATAMVDGRPVAVTGSDDETVRMWDLTTGRPVGEPLTGHTGGVLAVATAMVDGRPVAITGGHDKTVRVWDLTTGRPVGEALTGHTSQVRGVATAMVDDRTVAVTGSWDRTVRVWDLATGRQIGVPPARYDEKLGMVVDGRPEALGAMVVNGRPVTFPGSGGEALIGEHVGKPVAGHTEPVRAIATAELDGRLIAVISDGPESVGENVRAWDLNTGRQLWGPVTDRRGASVATAVLDGRPVAVILSGSDEVVRVRDLATGEQLREFPTNGRGGQTLATAMLDGRPVVVTGWPEVWDLTTGEQIHELKGPGDAVLSLAVEALDDRHLGTATGAIDGGEAVTEAKERTVVVAGVFGDACGSVWAWDLATGEQVGEPFEEAPGWPEGVSTVAVVVVDGHAAAAYGGALEGMCNLTTGEELEEEDYFGRGEAIKALTTTVIDGRSVLISGSRDGTVRMWDVARREQIGRPLAFPMPVGAVEVAPDGRLVVGFGPEIAVLARH
ncbi:WD40 repeat domain-containing protein [Streptomyces sp. NPDC056304]|uniref:WD40 repeat domain-containing protein n=1 Tax=Streptomyces sp. NPDC056304 TaxID=3345778 RepID=UPI0035DE61E1